MVTVFEALPEGFEVESEIVPLVTPVFQVTDTDGLGVPVLCVFCVPVKTPCTKVQVIVVLVVHDPEMV